MEIDPVINSTHHDNKPQMEIDEVLSRIGYGVTQFLLVATGTFLNFTFAYQTLLMYYGGDDPPWRCSTIYSNDSCVRIVGNQDISVTDDDFQKRCQMNRHEWTYTTDKDYSIVTQYDLVCSNEYIAALVNASFFIGWGIGGVFTAIVSDRFGRKICLVVSFLGLSVFAITSSFITAIWQLGVLRALIGAFEGTLIAVLSIYVAEYSVPKFRTLNLTVIQIGFSVSLVVLSVVAMYVRNWRKLELYAAFPGLVGFLITFFMPESARWLRTAGKLNQAKHNLENMIKAQKVTKFEFDLKPMPSANSSHQYSYIDLFRSCFLVIFVMAQAFGWMAVGLVYYALSLESSDLGGSIYENLMLSMLADTVGNFVVLFLCNYFGRRKLVAVSLGVCGIFLGCIGFVPKTLSHGTLIRIILAMSGKAFVVIAFSGFYIWTLELFPTVLRSQGMTVCQISSRIGSSSAPFVAKVLLNIYKPLPFIVMAVVSVLACGACLVLPETNKMPTRENYEDIFAGRNTVDDDVDPLLNGFN